MDNGSGFFLGLIAGVILYLLWKKETRNDGAIIGPQPSPSIAPQMRTPADTLGLGGCAGCSDPSESAAPAVQSMLALSSGQITPGTPPLQGALGVGSFYDPNGPTPDTNFWSMPTAAPSSTTLASNNTKYTNVPGSPTTPANQVPVRATQRVAPTSQLGFQQRYNVAGIPRTAGARQFIM